MAFVLAKHEKNRLLFCDRSNTNIYRRFLIVNTNDIICLIEDL